ncbi:MAG: hypothetical protein PHT99_10025, partial [Methanoregula sp.]|nr:hypothetical protein [Methanoregula sp.]
MAAKKADRKGEMSASPPRKKTRTATNTPRGARTVEDLTDVMTAQARLRGIAGAASPYAIMTTDSDGVITLFGAGAERMLGYRAE